MNITLSNPADGQGKVLVILFTAEFQALSLVEQGAQFQAYMNTLARDIHSADRFDQRNRDGMAIIYQFAEQLLPHIVGGDLALGERIVLQLRQEAQTLALTDLLTNQPIESI